MQALIESTGTLERRLTFSVPNERLQSQVRDRLQEISRTARINGFRPGKVPPKVVEQRFGAQVHAEKMNELLRETFDAALREHDLHIVGTPQITPQGDSGLDFVATVELLPDFGDIDVSQLTIVRPTAEVTDADIDRMINNLRQQRRTWNTVQRPAQADDRIRADVWIATESERFPAEGVENSTTVIGQGPLFAPIEQAFIGMAVGEEKTVDVEFPVDWRSAALAGKTAKAHLKLTEIDEPVLPEVNADFIRSFGVQSGEIDQFRADIRANLERELKGALMNRLRREVNEKLIAAYADVALPPRLVENEARALLEQQQEQLRRRGQEPETPAENAHEAFLETARNRIRVGLLVSEIAQRNKLRLEQERLLETLRLIASTYEQPEQVIAMYRNDQQLLAQLQNRVMEEQVIDWIAERAQQTEQVLSFQQAIGL